MKTFSCPVEATISLIGGKYKAIILWHLVGKTLRFSELSRLVCTFRINGAPFPRQRCKRLAPAVRYPFVVTC